MAFEITSARELSRAFFKEHPRASRLLVRDYQGTGLMFTADTRMGLRSGLTTCRRKEGRISESLAYSATLDISFGVSRGGKRYARA